MEDDSLISGLRNELSEMPSDVKAEAQLAQALDRGMSADDFMVSCEGLFAREFSRDMTEADIKEDARRRNYLLVRLSRSGIYDQLPEGLFFHQGITNKPGYKAADMAADHKLSKRKEDEIRRFFQPFDNDFFWQRLQLELEESRLLEGLQSGILNDYFVDFWNIPRSIPKHFIAPLVLLLPFAHQISGNLHLTAECLEQLLLEQVKINQKGPARLRTELEIRSVLGEAKLGVDAVLGEAFADSVPVVEFEIGPLMRSRIADYLEEGSRHILLQTFCRFFIPAGVDVEFSLQVPVERQQLVLSEEESAVLGYSSVLTG